MGIKFVVHVFLGSIFGKGSWGGGKSMDVSINEESDGDAIG